MSTKRDKRYHHGDLRRALVEAATAIIRTQGVPALTLREAARRAGVSHAAPAHHFGDKRHLLAAVAVEGYRGLGASLMAASRNDADPPLARLKAVGLAYVRYAAEHPALFRAIYHPALGDKTDLPELLDAAHESFSPLLSVLEECQAHGLVRAGDVRLFGLTAWCAVHGLAVLAVDGQLDAKGFTDPLAKLAAGMADTLFTGLRPMPVS